MDLFQSVKTLNDLKNFPGGKRNLLEEIKKNILSIKDTEKLTKNIIDWLNNIFKEYNRLDHNRNQEDDNILFDVINECSKFMPLSLMPALLTNLCIISDDESNTTLHNSQFIPSLDNATKIVNFFKNMKSFTKINEELYLDLGFLCFKAHKYDDAQEYLKESINLLKNRIESNNEDEDAIFQHGVSSIYLASCIEYDASIHNLLFESKIERKEKLAQAIEILLGCDEANLKENIYNHIEDIERLSNVAILKYSLANIKKLLENLSNTNCPTLKIFELSDDEHIKELQNEYIHILAHCISEYASVIRDLQVAKFPFCSLLQMISRFFLDWLVANRNKKYITCQATVRAENDATPEAINILLQKIEESTKTEENDSNAELNFYIFYFAEQELRWNYENKQLQEKFQHHRKLFLDYAKSKEQNQDVDALFHHHVIYFRFLLKQCVHHIISLPNSICDRQEQEMDLLYDELTDINKKISHFVLEPIRSEFDRLEKLYKIYRIIRNINNSKPELSNGNSNEFEMLLNFSEKNYSQDANDALKRIYKEITEPRNILLLAPIRSAPSCSFSIENVDKLKTLKLHYISNLTIDFSEFFNITIPELDQSSIEETIQLELSAETAKQFKWAIFYKNNKLFLFYSDFKPDRELKMFPVILNDEEVIYCDSLFEKLSSKHKKRAHCTVKKGSCKNARVNVCYANKYKYNDKEIHDVLLNILIFVEFDFHKLDKNSHTIIPRIDDNDIIIVDISKEKEYKIAAFENFEESRATKQICALCRFSSCFSLPSEQTPENISENKDVDSERCNCPDFNFQEIQYHLSKQLGDTPDESIFSSELKRIAELIPLCKKGKHCLTTGESCELIDLLYDHNFPESCWRL